MEGPDCIQIPGALLTTNAPAIVSMCGHKGLCTTAACATGTVCCQQKPKNRMLSLAKVLLFLFSIAAKTVPFQLNFNSDNYEWSANEAMAANANTGFRVRYVQDNSCT